MTEQTKFSITDISKLVELSRQSLYRNYINKGVLSVIRNGRNAHVELTELVRVFPDIKLLDKKMDMLQHWVTAKKQERTSEK
ncbi:MAG: hypothetical protein ACK4M7_00375 [Burkholderiales bacterium]